MFLLDWTTQRRPYEVWRYILITFHDAHAPHHLNYKLLSVNALYRNVPLIKNLSNALQFTFIGGI